MPFQNYIQLSRLDQAFAGVPFVNGSTVISADFSGLETAYEGMPYAGTVGNVLGSSPASGLLSGRVQGIHMYHPTNSYRVAAAAAALSAAAAAESVGPMVLLAAQLVFSEFYGYAPRVTPAVEYYNDFRGLDWSYNGEPLCQVPVNDVMDLMTLDYFYQGQPLSGATGPKDRIAYSSPGAGQLSGSQTGLISHLLPNVALQSIEARTGAIFPVVVPQVPGILVLEGSCVQVGFANWIYITGAVGSAPASMSAAGWRGFFTPPGAQAVLSGSVVGVHIPSNQVAGALGVLSLSGAADVGAAYKGVIAEPAVLSVSVVFDIAIQVKQQEWWGRDSWTMLSLPLDGSWADSSTYNRTPTVVGSPVNNVTGLFGSGGRFLEHQDVVTYPYSTDWNIVTGDFNISFRFKPVEQPLWPVNSQYDWRICSCVKFEWEWALPYDPYYPDRGETWGNGWDLRVVDDGYGPQVILTAYRDYIWSNPPYIVQMHTYAVVLKNIPLDPDIYESAVPLNEWIHISLGREGEQGFVTINGVKKSVQYDFSFDGASTAFFDEITGYGYSQGPYAIDAGTEFVLGGANPYSDDPFSNRVYSSALGVIDEFQIDRGGCRVFSGNKMPPFPLSAGAVPDLIGGLLSCSASLLDFPSRTGSRRIYECQFSGVGLDAITVPISSFTARQRTGDSSYSEVSVPGLLRMADILARKDGFFSVFASVVSGDGSEVYQREMLFESAISTIVITGSSAGGANQAMTVSGYRTTEVNEYPKTQPIAAGTYISRINGVRAIRSGVIDIYLKPGDTVQYEDDEFIAGSISYYMSAVYGASMEVREG